VHLQLGLRNEPRFELSLEHCLRSVAPEPWRRSAKPLEHRFSLTFETLTWFSRDTLHRLHEEDPDGSLLNQTLVVSESDRSVLPLMEGLEDIANREPLNDTSRRNYLDLLLRVYGLLPFDSAGEVTDPGTFFVGIEREGRILASLLGCLPQDRSACPHAKRIHHDSGLLVGFTGLPMPVAPVEEFVVIDGAIASGATQITLIDQLARHAERFRIYSAHATWQGLRAIARYGRARDVRIRVVVGHATSGLNDHFYAVTEADASRVAVGDLGDTIFPVS
jgi:uracil phosphoribosyltransferase